MNAYAEHTQQPLSTADELNDADRQTIYRFYADIFLAPIHVPGSAWAETLRERIAALLETDGLDPVISERFDRFVCDAVQDAEAAQMHLALDRSMLFRATKQADGPLPPREGLYRFDQPERTTVQQLNAVYARYGSGLAEGVHESPDYIGIESAFMAELITASLDAAGNADETVFWKKAQREFLERHMLRWVPDCCTRLASFAETDAFAGLMYLFRDFIEQESCTICER